MSSEHDSQSPLLGAPPRLAPDGTAIEAEVLPPAAKQRAQRRPQTWVTFLSIACITMFDTGEFLSAAPRLRAIEAVLCRRHYQSGKKEDQIQDIPEHLCKIDSIQDSLVSLMGWLTLCFNIPTLFLGIPYGKLADIRGRRHIMALAYLGATLATGWILMICFLGVDAHLILYSSLFYVLGGGPAVVSAMTLLVISDVTPDAQRAKSFYYCLAATLSLEVVAPAVGSLLMSNFGIWLPLGIGFALICATPTTVLLFMPETLQVRPAHTLIEAAQRKGGHSLVAVVRRTLSTELGVLTHDSSTPLLVFAAFVTRPAFQAMELVLQYVPKRYGWAIKDVAYLSSFRSAWALATLLLILPALNGILSRMAPLRKDLTIARVSLLCMILGYVVIGLAPNVVTIMVGLVITSLGSGFNGALRSLIIGLVKQNQPEHLARIYTFVAMSEAVGGLISGPFISMTFRLGMRLGPAWLGLPYMASAVLFLVPCTILWRMSLS